MDKLRARDPYFDMLFFGGEPLHDTLDCAIAVVAKRYGGFPNNRRIQVAFARLRDCTDPRLGNVALAFFLARETTLSRGVRDSIPEDHRKARFERFLVILHDYVDKTVRFPYDKHNVYEIFTNFEAGMRREYTAGPYLNLK